MLKDTYFDTYRRYKAGTAEVLQWLANSANRETAQTRLTGTAGRVQKSPSVPLSTILQLARDFAEADPPLVVPEHILRTLRWVIAARKECAAYHESRPDKELRPGDVPADGHHHFLSILVELLHILSPLYQPQKTSAPQHPSTQQSPGPSAGLANRFEHLNLYDPVAAETKGSVPLTAPATFESKQKVPATQLPVEDDTEKDGEFACFCFLKDWYDIRSFIQSIWRDYKERKITLTVAAITTSLAIDSIERIHLTLVGQFPKYAEYVALDKTILSDPSMVGMGATDALPSDMHDRAFFTDKYDFQAPLPGREAFSMLQHFSQAYANGIFKDFHTLDEQFDWAEACAKDVPARTQLQKMNILVRLVPDMVAFGGGETGPKEPFDQLTQRVLQLYKTHEVTVPLVFACDILVDILYILGSDVSRPFAELGNAVSKAIETLRKYEIYTNKVLRCDKASDDTLQAVRLTKDWTRLYVVDDRVKNFRDAHIAPKRQSLTAHCLLRHHPMLCGMLRFHIERLLHYIGLRMCNEWMSVIPVLHLYNAARQSGCLSRPWNDLDQIVNIFGASYIYVGDPPTSEEQYASRLLAAHGLPPSVARREMRKKDNVRSISLVQQIQTSRTAGRLLQIRSPLLTVIRERYRVAKKKQGGTILHEVEVAMDSIPELTHISDESTALIVQRWKRERIVTPVGLLRLVREGVRLEDFELHFDFCEMNRRCLELLRRIRDFAKEEHGNNAFMNTCSDNLNLYVVAQMVLFQGRAVRGSADSKTEMMLLKAAAKRMDDLIEREGGKECAKARQSCLP